jgi:hypothetical protein
MPKNAKWCPRSRNTHIPKRSLHFWGIVTKRIELYQVCWGPKASQGYSKYSPILVLPVKTTFSCLLYADISPGFRVVTACGLVCWPPYWIVRHGLSALCVTSDTSKLMQFPLSHILPLKLHFKLVYMLTYSNAQFSCHIIKFSVD